MRLKYFKWSAGQWIDTWKIGIGSIGGSVGSTNFAFSGTVSIQGRTSNGTWLQALNGTQPAVEYALVNQTNGFTALWGRSGGWMTTFLGAEFGDDGYLWSLNGANVNYNSSAKVVGYQLRTFQYIGDASFAFDSTI